MIRRLGEPATSPALAISAPSVNRDGDRVAVALGHRMKAAGEWKLPAASYPSFPRGPTSHTPRGRIAQIRSSNLLPISANGRGALGAAHKAPNAAWSVDTCLGLRAGQRVAFCHPPRRFCLGDTDPERQRDIGSVTTQGTRAYQPEAGTHSSLPLSAQELGPAPQLHSPGRSKGYFSFETIPILVSLAT